MQVRNKVKPLSVHNSYRIISYTWQYLFYSTLEYSCNYFCLVYNTWSLKSFLILKKQCLPLNIYNLPIMQRWRFRDEDWRPRYDSIADERVIRLIEYWMTGRKRRSNERRPLGILPSRFNKEDDCDDIKDRDFIVTRAVTSGRVVTSVFADDNRRFKSDKTYFPRRYTSQI